MSLQVIFPSSLKSRQPSKGGWKQLTPRFIIFPCKMAIGSTTCWLENNAKSILYVTEEIAQAYEDKNSCGIEYFGL